jgi:hypothetical protein
MQPLLISLPGGPTLQIDAALLRNQCPANGWESRMVRQHGLDELSGGTRLVRKSPHSIDQIIKLT